MSLTVNDLSFSYGPKTALNAVGFDVEAGTFAAVLGPNGAGKSTLFALMTRLFVANSGRIRISGHDLRDKPMQAMASLGVVFQQSTLDLDLSVRQNLRYFAALHGLSRREADHRITSALERLDMSERVGEKVRNLNGGHRRRTEIARALLHSPDVLLLDEPTVGLDAATRTAITDHVHQLCSETGVTVLWATHLTDEVRDDDRLIVLHQGQILADGICGKLRDDVPLSTYFLSMTGASV